VSTPVPKSVHRLGPGAPLRTIVARGRRRLCAEGHRLRLLAAITMSLSFPGHAHGAGSGMPWEAPLQSILESIEGPVAKVIAVITIIVTGLSLAFGDSGGGLRRLLQIVFGLSIAFAATSFFLSFFSFAGGALIN
jgi:type IV secretion system protein VirB2